MEIVAFVGSVGPISLPFKKDGGDDEVLSREYMSLVEGVTREQVDKEITRCPHKETSQRMEDVSRHA